MHTIRSVRLFLALDLSAALRDHLSRLQSILEPTVSSAAFTQAENLHVTLKFLGDVPDAEVPGLCTALRRLSPAQTLRLSAGSAECFPSRGPVRIIGIGLIGDLGALLQLQSAIEKACHTCGHALETRPFTPHVTLARARTPLPPSVRLKVADAVAQVGPSPVMQVTEFVLMESHLTAKGARYQPAARFAFARELT